MLCESDEAQQKDREVVNNCGGEENALWEWLNMTGRDKDVLWEEPI